MRDFNSDAHVEEWVAENGGVDALRRALARGTFAGQNKTLAAAWLQLHDRRKDELAASEERSLLERSVKASERSAESAQRAAKWAMWAVIVAVIALVATVVQELQK